MRRNDDGRSDSACTAALLLSAIVFGVALIVRALYISWRGVRITGDSSEYLALAANILGHKAFSFDVQAPFTPTIRRPPLYPGFLALCELLGGVTPIAIGSVQAIIDAGVAAAIFVFAKWAGAGRWAIVAAGTYVFYPGAIVASATLLTETLFTGLIVAGALTLVFGFSTQKAAFTAIAGFCFGLAILCRPAALLLPIVLAGVIVWSYSSRRRVLFAVLLLGTALITILPWVVRTSLLAHRMVPVQAWSGISFYLASRIDWPQTDEETLLKYLREDPTIGSRIANAHRPEQMAQLDADAWRAGFVNIRSSIYGYLVSRVRTYPVLFLSSFDSLTGFNESFRSVIARRDLARLVIKLAMLVVFSFVPFFLAVVGLESSRHNPVALLAASVWITLLVVYIPMWVENRYWWPAVPFMLVTASIAPRRLACGRRNLNQSTP